MSQVLTPRMSPDFRAIPVSRKTTEKLKNCTQLGYNKACERPQQILRRLFDCGAMSQNATLSFPAFRRVDETLTIDSFKHWRCIIQLDKVVIFNGSNGQVEQARVKKFDSFSVTQRHVLGRA